MVCLDAPNQNWIISGVWLGCGGHMDVIRQPCSILTFKPRLNERKVNNLKLKKYPDVQISPDQINWHDSTFAEKSKSVIAGSSRTHICESWMSPSKTFCYKNKFSSCRKRKKLLKCQSFLYAIHIGLKKFGHSFTFV